MTNLYKLIPILLILISGLANAQPIFEKSVSNLRDHRYCEILYGKRHWLNLEVKVFNTQGLNLCPEDQWKTITKEEIAKKYDASFVDLNGPRYWTMDEVQAGGATVNNVKAVQTLDKNGKVQFIPVTTGIKGLDRTEIIKGVTQGEKVIIGNTAKPAAILGGAGG